MPAEVVRPEEPLLLLHLLRIEGLHVAVFDCQLELVQVRSGLVAALLDDRICGVLVAVGAEVVDVAVDHGVLLAALFVLLVAADQQLVGFRLASERSTSPMSSTSLERSIRLRLGRLR